MKTLPVIPVETAAAPRTRPTYDEGIVPPWLETQPKDRNPGIVPPWLQHPVVGPDTPVGGDDPHILGGVIPTAYEPHPIIVEPDVPRIMDAIRVAGR